MLRIRLRIQSNSLHLQVLDQSAEWYEPRSDQYDDTEYETRGVYSIAYPALDRYCILLRGADLERDNNVDQYVYGNHSEALSYWRKHLYNLLKESRRRNAPVEYAP